VFLLPLILTMMHLCIMLYTYWAPLYRPTGLVYAVRHASMGQRSLG